MPDWKAEVRRRIASLRLPSTRESEIVEELAQDAEDRYAVLLRDGMSPADAEAHLLAGNLLFKAHRAKEALPEYETYLRLDPGGEFATQTQDMVQKIKQALAVAPKN